MLGLEWRDSFSDGISYIMHMCQSVVEVSGFMKLLVLVMCQKFEQIRIK